MKCFFMLVTLLNLFLFLSIGSANDNQLGVKIYQKFCAPCHASGMAGAPIVGDREAWALPIWQGLDVLKDHAVKGYKGTKGYMPAKGGHNQLSDEEVNAAVEYMVTQSQQ